MTHLRTHLIPSLPPSVSYCEVLTEPSGRSKGCGIVEYNSSEEVREGGREGRRDRKREQDSQ